MSTPRRAVLRPTFIAAALVAGLLAGTAGAASVPAVRSAKAAAPLVLDGRAGEWAGLDRLVDNKAGIEAAFQNDGRNLYILLVPRTPEAAKAVAAAGITVLGRPAGSRKPAKGVRVQTRAITPDGLIFWRESQGAIMTEAEKAELRKTPRHPINVAFVVESKGSSYGPIRRQAGSDPPDFAASPDMEAALYEVRVPLASPEAVPGAVGGAPGAVLRVTLEWGGAVDANLSTRSSRESPDSRSGYMSGTGRTWGQEFLDSFDSMSRPSEITKKFSLTIDVTLADVL